MDLMERHALCNSSNVSLATTDRLSSGFNEKEEVACNLLVCSCIGSPQMYCAAQKVLRHRARPPTAVPAVLHTPEIGQCSLYGAAK